MLLYYKEGVVALPIKVHMPPSIEPNERGINRTWIERPLRAAQPSQTERSMATIGVLLRKAEQTATGKPAKKRKSSRKALHKKYATFYTGRETEGTLPSRHLVSRSAAARTVCGWACLQSRRMPTVADFGEPSSGVSSSSTALKYTMKEGG